jgi:cyclopentanol dehydrogenase
VLVNNAGISIPGSIEEYTEDDWERSMAVNMKRVFLGTKHAIPAMRRAGGGSISNISSGADIAPAPGTSAAYAATKGGVRLFTKATAVQHAGDNIRCNSVHPGPVDTPMIRGPQHSDDWLQTLLERVPLGRLGTSEDIAYGVLYLASDEASFVTGSELVIDGGRTAQ